MRDIYYKFKLNEVFMRKSSILVFVISLTFFNQSILSQQKSFYKYKVIIDLGSDVSDPLFSEYLLKDFIKERMSQRLPEFGYTDFEVENAVVKLTLLTQAGNELKNLYASALNLLITSPFHNTLNWNVLLIDSKEESLRSRIRDFIDRWILEYSAYVCKSLK